MQNSDYKRLARIEAMANSQRAELLETLKDAYERACTDGDIESASAFARKVREKILSESDWTQTVDSPLSEMIKLQWAAYRQGLRDIPEQAGFPLAIDWPSEP